VIPDRLPALEHIPATHSGSEADRATLPVMLAGFCAFFNLFVTQPILPLLARLFHASKAGVSLTVTAATFGVAIAAPFAGVVSDRIGRRTVIVRSAIALSLTTIFSATASGLPQLVFWRFLQGLATPGVFAVTVAYINDEWPADKTASAVGAYVSGTVLGGFAGRMVAGLVAEFLDWRWIFVIVGVASLGIAVVIARGLPPERGFRGVQKVAVFGPALEHLRNPRLLATFASGFCVLFSMIALFTYATFHLAAQPFLLSPGKLGAIFCVYLAGAAITPAAGRAIDRYGHRPVVLGATLLGTAGALATLIPTVPAILFGLMLGSCGVFVAHSAAISHVGVVAGHARALAVGLYVSFYYTGGSFGSTAPAWIWESYGWPGCVALLLATQAVLAATAWWGWHLRSSSVRGLPDGR
jgi:predicted MFS family arabinose efflux permease